MKYLPGYRPSWKFRKDQDGDKTFLIHAQCTHCSQTDYNGCWIKWYSGSFETCKICAVLVMGRPQYLWGGGQLKKFTGGLHGKKAHFHRWGGMPLWKDRCRIFKTLANPSWNRSTNVGMRREAILLKDKVDYLLDARLTPQPPGWLKQLLAYLEEQEKGEEPAVYLRGKLCQVVGKNGKSVFHTIEEFMTSMPLMRDRTHRGDFGELMRKLGDADIVIDGKQGTVTDKKGDGTTP